MTPTMVKEQRITNRILTAIKDYIITNKLGGIPPKILDRNVSGFKQVMDNIKKDIDNIAEESENLTDFQEKVGVYIKVNPMTTEANTQTLLDAIKGVSSVFEDKMGKYSMGSTAQLTGEVVRNDSTLYMTKLGEDVQSSLRNTLEQGLNSNKSMEFIRDEMHTNIDSLDKNRAEAIARTETARAYNQAEKVKAEESGKEYFIVVSTPTCCEDCYEAYNGNTFHLPEDEDMIPPYHPNCNCNAVFFKSESQAEDMSQEVSKERPDLQGTG